MGVVGIMLGIPGIGNSREFLGIPSSSQGIDCTTQSGNGNSWEQEFLGISGNFTTLGLVFPWKSAAILGVGVVVSPILW